jgi:hypothetical protein
MQNSDIKKAAFRASKRNDEDMAAELRGLSPHERLYFLQMVYYYRLFSEGGIKLNQAREIEQRIYLDHTWLDNALRLSGETYNRQICLARETNMERTKLSKQLRAGDHDFIDTLFHLLDLYSGEMVYCRMYRAMQPPMTDAEMERIITEVPEEYRRGMTPEETRAAVWNVVRQLNGDYEIEQAGKNTI